uniref:Ig-like domain-containing protein n=1 Tax=Sinocyclocheilus anshuiensis TaxID=1608454 RepID=A0A671SB13_9TELE
SPLSVQLECLAKKYLTVAEGETLVLKCPRKNFSENRHMEWRNPQGHLLFFNNEKALRDPRSSIFTLNNSEYTFHLSNITLNDEGLYKCLLYDNTVITKRFKVKVLGMPKIEMAEYKDKTIIKCSAEANGHPPELSWLISGVEIEGKLREVSDILTVKTHIRRATVMCLAKHTALPKQLIDFVTIENHSCAHINVYMKIKATCKGRELLIAVLLCVFAGFGKQHDLKESSHLLILLVTCLVICLFIVVIFFVIRLRRAHIAWKKGNIRLFIYLYFKFQLYSRGWVRFNSGFNFNLLL